ncbi:accessory gene regulator B [Gottschalkia acidurici 9a]|uniref:Accessory gene regulator B n=1 Tax=Gottschalkia acidurici (strain ATCC 7906 / DSM 604 / BCRC 14475 / CIP 104303 / KCTC 5404 / NCIMB 10678 / 9a) TaxID=1128398 RepID=K0B0K4_GOTA9|nr:accessory gene regulator B family protein [Gottschalkia acidurici]AFS78430.1 accessory gene regulator B [Gottschalkia acidurici 9a]
MNGIIKLFAYKIYKHTDKYNKDKHDKDEWREVLEYIVYRIMTFTLLITMLVILSNLFTIDNDIYVFTISFLILKRKFGGMHLESEVGCFILSLIFPLIVYFLFKNTHTQSEILIIMSITSAFMLAKIGTVDNVVRKLKKEHKLKLQKQGIIVLIIMLSINLYTNNQFISLALIFTVINCLIGKIQYIKKIAGHEKK